MKIKEIFLDFTPLLDITLILLFFFLMFSRFEIGKLHSELSAQQDYLDSQIAEVEIQKSETEELKRQYEEKIEFVQQYSERSSSNIDAMLDFSYGNNIKLILSESNNNLILSVYQGDLLLCTANTNDDISYIISNALISAGFETDDTILCEFILDGSQPGTASAYRIISSAITSVKQTYNFFYYSETDISMTKG